MPTSVPPEAPPAKEKKGNRKARHTLWVLNNWTEIDLEKCRDYAEISARYMCWSQEVGEKEKTPHLQGYVAWDSPHSLEKFKKDLGGKLHYGDEHGNTNGTAWANRQYCLGQVKKKGFTDNPTFEEYGEIPKQGERTDWAHAVRDLQAGTDISSVVEHQPQLLPCVRALERFQMIRLKPLHRPVNVIVITGRSGWGKTRWAYDNYPDLYSKPSGPWWDGYTGQKTILLDDYYGDIPYDQFLRVLDRYPINLPIKGGFVYGQYTTVIITSNHTPSLWYVQGYTDALNRRISIHRDEHNHAPEETHVSIPEAESTSSSRPDAPPGSA